MNSNMKNALKKITACTLGALMLTGCSDFLDRTPMDEIVDETYWKTQQQLEMAATAIYSRVKAKNFVDMENRGENTMWPTTNQYKDIGSGVFPVTQPTVDNEWRNMYRDIRECNAFLENYQTASETEPGAKERLAAEVRVIRALAYSFLVRSEEHTSELQSRENLVCRLLLEKKKKMLSDSDASD